MPGHVRELFRESAIREMGNDPVRLPSFQQRKHPGVRGSLMVDPLRLALLCVGKDAREDIPAIPQVLPQQ
jgi:hypothetical protein